MNTTKGLPIEDHFAQIEDPRQAHKTAHSLLEIITLTICAVICGANTWVEVETYGRANENWLKTFLALPNGIPSHDTLGRVFSLLDPKAMEACFQSWVATIAEQVEGVVAIDGKTVRRSHDSASGKSAIHLVSAWCSDAGLVLGQLKTDEKSNEIKAIPELLKKLVIKGCVVTIDAMGCQKAIAQKIVDQEADYVFTLKGNQENLHDEVRDRFQYAHEMNFEGMEWSGFETESKSHGRHEIRRYWLVPTPDDLVYGKKWPQLNSIGMVEYECQIPGRESTREYRYFITSLKGNAELFAKAVRSHWGIENSVHWILDVVFREDESRVRIGHAAENFGLIRRLALNLLTCEKTAKVGVRAKRLKAAVDENYLTKVLNG